MGGSGGGQEPGTGEPAEIPGDPREEDEEKVRMDLLSRDEDPKFQAAEQQGSFSVPGGLSQTPCYSLHR